MTMLEEALIEWERKVDTYSSQMGKVVDEDVKKSVILMYAPKMVADRLWVTINVGTTHVAIRS